MARTIYDCLPNEHQALETEPEELSDYVFENLRLMQAADPSNQSFNPGNFLNSFVSRYPDSSRGAILERIVVAFRHLATIGLIYETTTQQGWYRFSPRGTQIRTAEEAKEYRLKRRGNPRQIYEQAAAEMAAGRDKVFAEMDAKSKEVQHAIAEAEQRAQQQVRDAEERVRKSATHVSAVAAQELFEAAQKAHLHQAWFWAVVSTATVVGFAYLAWHLGTSRLPNESTGFAIYYTAIRITVLTALGAVATFCLRVLRAHLHMRELNLHRKRLTGSIAAFVELAGTSEQRDTILSHLVDAVATFGNSGLLPDTEDSLAPAKLAIDSITRHVSEK